MSHIHDAHDANNINNNNIHNKISQKSYEERKFFFENIKNLVKNEYEELYRILKRGEEEYTENSNGIFFNVLSISEDTFLKMNEYMTFCLKNRKEHEERLKELNELIKEKEFIDNNHKIEGIS
jgi:hypothetical protein